MEIKAVITSTFFLFTFIYCWARFFTKNKKINTKFLARTGLFAAISIILYIIPVFNLSLPFFPSFLNIHFDEVPALIAGFAYGPLSGLFVIIAKTLAKLPMSSTAGVGELADLLYSAVFVITAALIYKRKRNAKGALIAFGVSSLIQILVSSLFTSFVMLDFYIFVMGLPEEAILMMCQAINPQITDLGWPFLLMVAIPFNAFKDLLVVIITFLLYKRLHSFIDKIKA